MSKEREGKRHMKRTKKNLTKTQIEVMNDGVKELERMKSFKTFNDYLIWNG